MATHLSDLGATNADIVTKSLFSALGVVGVNDYYDGVKATGPTGTSRPLGTGTGNLGYATLGAAQVDYPKATALTDEVDWCVWQAAADAGYAATTARIWADSGSVSYIVNKPILFNGAATLVEGAAPNLRYGGTGVTYNGAGGTIDAPVAIFDFYTFDEHGLPGPGKTFNFAFGGCRPIVRNIRFNGKNGNKSTSDQSAGHFYVWGIRIRQAEFAEVDHCSFDFCLYDGIVFTAPQLFVKIHMNFFGNIARDAISNLAAGSIVVQGVGPSSNNSTTIWIYNNEFIGCDRYPIFLDFSGGAVEPFPIIRDNDFECLATGGFYYNNPSWYVHGVRSWGPCIINGTNLVFDANRFEGDDFLAWRLHLVDCTAFKVSDCTLHSGVIASASGGDLQARSDQAIAFTGTQRSITGITKANPAVVTNVAHGYSNGNTVFLWNVLGMTQVNGLYFTVTVVDADHFSIGVDSTGYGAYTSAGRALVGANWWDVTNARNYNAASVGHTSSSAMEQAVFRHNYNFGGLWISDGIQLAATGYNSCYDQSMTIIVLPTENAPVATIQSGVAPAKIVSARDVGVPTLLDLYQWGQFRLYNTIGMGIFGTLYFDAFDTKTGNGSYRIYRYISPWTVSTVYATTFGTESAALGSNVFVRPTNANENGFFYQITTGGTSGSTEPSWSATPGASVTQDGVTYKNVGRVNFSAENEHAERQEDGLRRRMGTAAPVAGEGRFAIGDKVYAYNPHSVGFEGWVCSVAGAPGTWKTFGVVTA